MSCVLAACGQNATPGAASRIPHATTTSTGASTSGASPSAGPSTAAPDSSRAGGETALPAGGEAGSGTGAGAAAGGGAAAGAGRASPSKQGLDQPVGAFAHARGVSGVTSNSSQVVTGYTLDFTQTDGARVALSRAKAELTAYLPRGISYGAESDQGSCHALQIDGSAKPATATFCSTTATQSGIYSSSSIAEVFVANEPGFT